MTLWDAIAALRRRWWLIVLVPALALPLMLVRARTMPYQASFNAIVILPGDTEIPGNSERPELMVMDDVPALISSVSFAEAVAKDAALNPSEVHGTLSGTRYSRVLTVRATDDNRAQAEQIAKSAANVLAAQVNQFLVADQSATMATVQIIDPPGDATRSRPNQMTKIAALTVLAAGIGAALALVAAEKPFRRKAPSKQERLEV